MNRKNITTIEIDGGLGNQLFQFAVGLLIAKTWNNKICFDATNYKNRGIHEGYLLKEFVLQADRLGFSCETTKQRIKLMKWLRCFIERQRHDLCLESMPYKFSSELLERRWRYVSGSWQSYKYLQNNPCVAIVRDVLTSMFRESNNVKRLKRYGDFIVAIHVRRGDYLLSINKGYGVLPMRYYLEAMSRARAKMNGCKFLVLSDDPKYVDGVFAFEDCITVSQLLGVGSSLRDLYIMSRCNAMITANSSLSWWGASLQEGDDIITPAKWFEDKKNDELADLIPPTWTRIAI